MGIADQMRAGFERLIALDKGTAIVTRQRIIDNGRGVLIENGELDSHTISCRVSVQASAVWSPSPSESGMVMNTTPYLLAKYNADIKSKDSITWRDETFTVGEVTRPHIGGSPVCTQAALTKVISDN